MQPIEVTCGRCGGVAWTAPFISYQATVCARCTFGDPALTLVDMIKLLKEGRFKKSTGGKHS